MIFAKTFHNQADLKIAIEIQKEIPIELDTHISICGSCISGGVIVDFYSNKHKGNVIYQNSKHSFKILLETTDRFGNPLLVDGFSLGCTVEPHNFYNVPKMRGNQKPIYVRNGIKKITKFINEHKDEFISYINQE